MFEKDIIVTPAEHALPHEASTQSHADEDSHPVMEAVYDLRAGFKAKNFLESLSYAFGGLVYATRTQRNFRTHLCLAALSLGLASFLQISLFEWALLWGMIGLVLFAELVNTIIELVVDMFTAGEYDARAKMIKDMAAGAVFVTALTAISCGVCIFVPHLVDLYLFGI